MTVKTTAIPAAAGRAGVAYVMRGESCAGHVVEHGQEHAGPVGYYAHEQGHGVGQWWGKGLEYLGLDAGRDVTESDMNALFGDGCDPRALESAMAAAEERITGEGLTGKAAEEARAAAVEAARLGNRPYKFRDFEARVSARVADAVDRGEITGDDEEALSRIRLEVAREGGRKAAGFYDVTFSPSKSISIYYASLMAQGRTQEAARLRELHREAVVAALEHGQEHAGFARAGHHGRAPRGRASVGRYVAGDLVGALFDHLTNREGEPQLHTHATILSKVRTVDEDGSVHWRSLDSRGWYKTERELAALYERTLEESIEAEFPVAFVTREDGTARELAGVGEREVAAVSTRRGQVLRQVDVWAADYERRTGRPPTRYQVSLMSQAATLQTRKAKDSSGKTEAEMLAAWEQMVSERLQTSLAHMGEAIEAAGIEARAGDAGRPVEWDVDQVITAAIDAVQAKRARWSRADLMFEIKRALPERSVGAPATVLEALADRALTGAAGHEVLQVQGLTLLDIPAELQREDGRSMWRPHRDELYVLADHLTREERVLERAKARGGGMAVSPETAQLVLERAAREGRELSDDQAAVAVQVLTGGRHVDTVVGPAGTGKSRTVAEIAGAWRRHTGGRVVGLAPSSVAAEVLREEGMTTATNTTIFLDRAAGRGPVAEQIEYAVGAGDLVIVDEAGMTSTDHLVRVVELAEQRGAKVVLVGDDAQLSAVDAGGLFRLLVREGQAIELDTVHRFRDADGRVRQWEAMASMALRGGDDRALTEYQARDRIRGGTIEEMTAAIRRAALADLIEGRDAAVLTSTTEAAAELSAEVRAELVRLGYVEPGGAPVLDGNVAGVGDLIQARENTARLVDSDRRKVMNRRVYRVTGRAADGALQARHVTGRAADGREEYGGTVVLPAAYARQHVQLAYAGTIHSVQGRTVQRLYGLVDDATTREALYVLMTRGRELNRAYVVEHDGAAALDVMVSALDREGSEASALEALREEMDWISSLPATAPVWSDLVAQEAHDRYRAVFAEHMEPADFERLHADDVASVYRRVREAEQQGHDAAALIREAVTSRGFGDAQTMGAVMYARIDKRVGARTPEREPVGPSWAERTPQTLTGVRGEVARAAAALLDARRAELADRAAEQPPAWAVRELGPVPADPIERAQWSERAGAVEAYRELYGLQDAEGTVIGPAPGRGMVDQYTAWQQAAAALGRTQQERDMGAATAAELRSMVAEYEHAQLWAPISVTAEMRDTTEVAANMAERAAVARREAEMTADAAERARLLEAAEDWQSLAEDLGGMLPQWEEMAAERADWYAETAGIRDRAAAARAELAAREQDANARAAADAAEQTAERTADHAQEHDRQPTEHGQEREGRAVDEHQEHEADQQQAMPDRDEQHQQHDQGHEHQADDDRDQASARLLDEAEANRRIDAERERARRPSAVDRWAAMYEWETRVAAGRAEALDQPTQHGQEHGQEREGRAVDEHQEHEADQQQAMPDQGQQQEAAAELRTLRADTSRLAQAGQAVTRATAAVRDAQAAARAEELARREAAQRDHDRERAAVQEATRSKDDRSKDDDGPAYEL